MDRLKVAPTRSNLISIRRRLELVRQGHDLLDRKREVLINEILAVIEDAERIQFQVQDQFARAYDAIEEARAAVGTERVRRIALARPPETNVQITSKSIMGTVVPSVTFEAPDTQPLYGFGDTSVVLDLAQDEWSDVLSLMGELAEKVTTAWRLALELRRTQRRVNALENIFIPSYEETLQYIEDTLEEKSREELFRMKLTQSKLQDDADQSPRHPSTG